MIRALWNARLLLAHRGARAAARYVAAAVVCEFNQEGSMLKSIKEAKRKRDIEAEARRLEAQERDAAIARQTVELDEILATPEGRRIFHLADDTQ